MYIYLRVHDPIWPAAMESDLNPCSFQHNQKRRGKSSTYNPFCQGTWLLQRHTPISTCTSHGWFLVFRDKKIPIGILNETWFPSQLDSNQHELEVPWFLGSKLTPRFRPTVESSRLGTIPWGWDIWDFRRPMTRRPAVGIGRLGIFGEKFHE